MEDVWNKWALMYSPLCLAISMRGSGPSLSSGAEGLVRGAETTHLCLAVPSSGLHVPELGASRYAKIMRSLS